MLRTLFLIAALTWGAMATAAGVDFTLKGVDGKEHRLSDYRGKWVVVNYWATWCPPCREEIPELVRFYDRHKDKDAVVLGIDMEDVDVDYLKSFIDDNLISYPVLRRQPDMKALGPIPGLPTTYLVSPEGEVVARKIGGITEEELDSYIKRQSK